MRNLLIVFPVMALSAATIPMDSARGDRLFESQGCVQCHRLKGVGGTTASDLGTVLDRSYTPADLAGAMWNHAPAMWKTMQEKKVNTGELDQQAAADLFASFYSARYFEVPGDAGRGKRLFTVKSCARCHGPTASPNPQAVPVDQWQTISDPVALVGSMWNHSPAMWNELSKKTIPWPTLTAHDLADLLVYLRNVSPGKAAAAPMFRITAGDAGAKLFESKGCLGCHQSARPSSAALTLTGVAASMWNHASFLHLEPPRFDTTEMREVLSFYWAKQFFQSTGDPSKGRRLFAAKHCADCHARSGAAPALLDKAGKWNGMALVSALWRHGPAMLNEMNQKKIPWPTFRGGEMADLISYINRNTTK